MINKEEPPRDRPPAPPRPRIMKEGERNMGDVKSNGFEDWVEYASKREKEYRRDAVSFNTQGYKEMALVYAGRCMALQEMLENGGYPECVGKKGVLP